MLRQYKDVFARSLDEIKQYSHYELHLDLLSDRKVFRRQFRLHPDDEKKAQRQINDMHQAGVIEESPTADYNSSIFLVSKKNEVKLLVINLRGTNLLLTIRLVQLPKINKYINSVTLFKCKYMLLINLRSKYLQPKLKNLLY